MISGIKHQVCCCCALLWGFLVAEGNYLMSAPWAFIILVWIDPQSIGWSFRDISRSFRIWTGATPLRLGFISAQLTQMYGRKILYVTFTQQEETFKRPGPTITAKMRRNERNNMGSTGTIPYLVLESEDSGRRWQEKDSLCPIEIPYRIKQEQKHWRETKLPVTKFCV